MANGLHFKGTIAVLVDPLHLEARLALSKEGDLVYDDGALVRILADAGVTEGFEPEALSAMVFSFQKSKETSSEVVAANGQPPVSPVSETWEWSQTLVLSDEQRPLATRVIKAAGPPEVFQVRTEKVKVQKRVVGKGGLFGAGQEEVQTVIESRDVREKVLVDPNPLKVFWVEEGAPVALVYPAKPGVPGLDLSGKSIPAPVARPAPFFLGANLSRVKFDVVALTSGFLRIGRNWTDLVPHRPHRWSLSYSSDKTSAFVSFEPGDAQAAPVTSGPILSQLAADGFVTNQTPSESEIQALLDEAIASGRSVLARPLVPDREGSFAIHFSPDKAKAFLDIQKPLGRGAPFSLKDLGMALREAKLKGFSFDAVKGVLQDFLNGPESELKDFLLASGTSPTRGQDLVLSFPVAFLSPEDMAAVMASLAANPRYLETLPDRQKLPPDKVERAAPVRADQEFARLVSPEGGLGAEGLDVTGQKIPAIPGNEPPLVLLSNVRKHDNSFESTIDGLMEMAVIEGATVFRVRPHFDAMAAVHRSDDNLQAHLTLVQGKGTGRRLDKAMVDAALEAAQIRAGIDQDKLTQALETAQAGGKVEQWLIAHGTPAANDLARRLVFTHPTRIDAEGKRRCSIRPGEVAATYQPPAEGQVDGTDVLGNLIPSPDMEARSLVVSADFEVSTDELGRQVLKSLKGGELVFDGEGISINTQVAVASVGGKAGNVKFPGEVLVAGGVETGAYVVAGNLKVRGRVGGALLSSDHNIQVADGIHGEGKAVLRAKKHISVGFVERALVMAVGDVHVGKAALGCTFRVNGKIYQKAPGGGLQGGLAKVRLGLDVMNLGSAAGALTTVSFGQDYLIEDQIQAEVKETDKLRDAIVQLDVFMRKLTSPGDKERLNGARQKKVLLMKMLDKRNLKLINLRDKFELHVASEIVVRETLFPGVSIESHGRLYEPKARRTALKLVFNEQTGHIEEQPLN